MKERKEKKGEGCGVVEEVLLILVLEVSVQGLSRSQNY